MADSFKVELQGVDELKRALSGVSKKIRTKAVRSALRKAGNVIQAAARQSAPLLQVPVKTRTKGTVKKRITVRASKFARQAGNEGVFISVKPLRGKADTRRYGKAAAKNPFDPYYWWFLEFGTKHQQARPFLGPAASAKGEEAIQTFMREMLPQIEKLNKKEGGG